MQATSGRRDRHGPVVEDGVDDDNILIGVRAASQATWDQLWEAVDELLRERPWVTWVEPEETRPEGRTLGYPVYSEALQDVQRLLYDVGAIVNFSWPRWDGPERYSGGVGLEQAPAADAVRMLTCIFRAERFGDGTIDRCMRTGLLPRALRRLRRWHDEERDG